MGEDSTDQIGAGMKLGVTGFLILLILALESPSFSEG